MTRRRTLAHSLRDELPPSRPTFEPVRVGWRDVAALIGQVVAVGAAFYVLFVVLLALAS